MPYVSTTTTKKLTAEDRDALKSGLGRALEETLSKQEKWLMTAFVDEIPMTFGGDGGDDSVFVEISIFGSASDDSYDALTARLCKLYSDTLGVRADRIYIKYEESNHWGWNGANF